MDPAPQRRALLSVYDKAGLVDFARGLAGLGFQLVSTGGTAAALRRAGLEVVEVAQVTGFPELLDGRVKTLHPAIHAGLLARRDRPDDLAALRAQGIHLIDLVAVNLYPFRETAARGASEAEVVEQIDIGGPSLLRAAAKNFEQVAPVVDPRDYAPLLEELRAGAVSRATRHRLLCKVFAHTAAYDLSIAQHFAARDAAGAPIAAPPAAVLPETLTLSAERRVVLRYGENPHQRAAWYRWPEGGPPGLGAAALLQGKELSYNNLLDLNAALSCVREQDEVAAVVVKHNTPCGVATGSRAEDAYRLARSTDEQSAFGGIVALNAPVDAAAATALAETFLEAVIAPAFSPEACQRLGAKKGLRLLALPTLARHRPGEEPGGPTPLELRSVGDGLLLQEADLARDDPEPFRVVTRRAPTEDEWRALLFAWKVVKHVRSNAIVFAAPDRTLALGGGQTSRVEAVLLAARKGGAKLVGSAVASDAFFPFRDGLDAAARAGARCAIQPGGSVRDAEVIAAADEHDLAMVFTGRRHFRH